MAKKRSTTGAHRRRKREATDLERYVQWKLQGLIGEKSVQAFADELGLPKATLYRALMSAECGLDTRTKLCRAWHVSERELQRKALEWASEQEEDFRRDSSVNDR